MLNEMSQFLHDHRWTAQACKTCGAQVRGGSEHACGKLRQIPFVFRAGSYEELMKLFGSWRSRQEGEQSEHGKKLQPSFQQHKVPAISDSHLSAAATGPKGGGGGKGVLGPAEAARYNTRQQ